MNRDHCIVGAGRVLQIFIALVSMRLMTHLLSGRTVGNIYLILSLTSYFSWIFVSPVGQYINRRLHKWAQDGELLSNFACYNFYILGISLLAFPSLVLYKTYFGGDTGLSAPMLGLLASGYIYSNTCNLTIIPSLNMLDHRISFVVLTTATLLLGLCFSVILVMHGQASAAMWIVGQIVAYVILAAIALYFIRYKLDYRLDYSRMMRNLRKPQLKGILKFGIPLIATAFSMWIQNQSYRILVGERIGLEFLAMLAVGFSIATSITSAAESIVQQIYYPIYYSEINTEVREKRSAAWQKISGATLPFYLLLALFISCLSSHIATVLVDKKFKMAALFAAFGAWIEFARVSANIFSIVAHSEMRTDSLAKPYILGGFISLMGVFFASRSSAYIYLVPTALVLGGFITFLLTVKSMRGIMQFSLPVKPVKLVVLLATPFPLALLVKNPGGSVLVSIAVLVAFGCYMLVGQYWIYRKYSSDILRV